MTTITREQLKQNIDAKKSFTLVDALPSEYYQKEHLPGAKSLPADTIGDQVSGILPDKNQMIVTYCASETCPKSKMAADKLKTLGYTNVVEYAGGIEDWKKGNLPLETKAKGEDAYGSGTVNKKAS